MNSQIDSTIAAACAGENVRKIRIFTRRFCRFSARQSIADGVRRYVCRFRYPAGTMAVGTQAFLRRFSLSVGHRRRKTPRDAVRLVQLTPCTGEPTHTQKQPRRLSGESLRGCYNRIYTFLHAKERPNCSVFPEHLFPAVKLRDNPGKHIFYSVSYPAAGLPKCRWNRSCQ